MPKKKAKDISIQDIERNLPIGREPEFPVYRNWPHLNLCTPIPIRSLGESFSGRSSPSVLKEEYVTEIGREFGILDSKKSLESPIHRPTDINRIPTGQNHLSINQLPFPPIEQNHLSINQTPIPTVQNPLSINQTPIPTVRNPLSINQTPILTGRNHLSINQIPIPTGRNQLSISQPPFSDAMNDYVEDWGAGGKIENFTGADGQSAVRWLRRFTRERVTRKDGAPVSASLWLEEIDGFLGGEAEKWADRTPAIKHLLDENTLDQRTAEDVTTFRRLFLDHFQNTIDAPFENAIPQIQSLCQSPNESLLVYHRQASGLLIAAGGKDITGANILPLEPSIRSILDLAIDRYINGLSNMSLRLRMLRYTANPNRSLRGAYMVAETEMKQMMAEKDLLHSMKVEKELELWRKMKTTMEQSNENANSPSVLALLSQIKMVVAEEEDPLSKFKLDGNSSNSTPNSVISPPNCLTSSYQASQLREAQNPNLPVDPRVTEIRDVQFPGPSFQGPARNQPGNQLPYNAQNQWQTGNYQGGNKSGAGSYHQRPKPAYGNPDWRANSGPRSSDPSKSLNPYINGSRIHRYSSDNPLCFRCGIPGHKSMDQQCTSPSLSQGEQLYLKQIVYDDIQKLRAPGPAAPQSNMARTELIQDAGYDDLQDTLLPSAGPFMSEEEKKEKTGLESENCKPFLFSHQSTVRVELEDGTLKDIELSSIIDIAGIKKRHVQHENPTVEDDVEEISQRDILFSLLLGLPCLESVDAVFKIRNEEQVIGDKANNEKVRVLKNLDLNKQDSAHLEIADKDSSEDEESSECEEGEDEGGVSDTDSESGKGEDQGGVSDTDSESGKGEDQGGVSDTDSESGKGKDERSVSDTDSESEYEAIGHSTRVTLKDQPDFCYLGPKQDQKGPTTRVKMKRNPNLTSIPRQNIHWSYSGIRIERSLTSACTM